MQPPSANLGYIMIVDDDEFVRSILRMELERDGFDIEEAADGLDACEKCRLRVPDLIIADVVMPRMDGFALCRELRADPRYQYIPILQATGLEDLPSIEKAYESGATDFICKPLNGNILKHRVRYMLRSSRAFDELRRNHHLVLAARDAADAANRAKSEFLANMSHELRTPLNAIIGFSTIMTSETREPLPQKHCEYARIIRQSGDHLLHIINDILDLAKVESNTLKLREEFVELASILDLVKAVAQGQAHNAGLVFEFEMKSTASRVRADPVRLKQILLNLLSNAVKFTPKQGSVRLSVGNGPNGELEFRVSDTGIGIAEDKIALAMAPFGQIDSRLARRYEGTGLGLPLTKRLVEMHGGTFILESKLGRGTTVTVRLPSADRFMLSDPTLEPYPLNRKELR